MTDREDERDELRRVVLGATGLDETLNDFHRSVILLTDEVRRLSAGIERTPDLDDVLALLDRRANELRAERRVIVRTVARILLVLVPFTSYIAIYAHEAYRDTCDLSVVIVNENRPAWCSYVFPGADHEPPDNGKAP